MFLKPSEIISNKEINNVWGNANFGGYKRRSVVNAALLKCASGYHNGHSPEFCLMSPFYTCR